jgi:ATP-dependent helicase/nuclease subunit A
MADTERIPIDQETRERIRVEIDRNMCVEAGAGTGKTTIMVDRIVEIVRTGYATIDSMVIITFTEKAAAELATRVREAFERALRDSDDDLERERFDQALKNIYRARIETIHAFASSLLRERPVEARLDPNFEVLDTLRADLSFEEQFRSWVNMYLGGDGETEFDIRDFRQALNRDLNISDLRTVCEIVHEHRYMLPLNIPDPLDPDVFAFREFLRDEAAELRALLPSVTDPDDKGVGQIYRVLNFAVRCDRAGNDRQRLERVILAASKTSETAGNNGNWDPSSHNGEQKKIRKNLNTALLQIQQELKTSALCAILPLAEEFARAYEQQRRFAGQAEFEDLLIWARDLLRDELHVRKDFQRRFKCLLVDEFQDTDPLQVEIVMYLASENQAETDWTKLTPTPGKLFVVGDPKQSIYRFRRADISIYEQVKEDVLTGNIEVINQNFRSVPEVIDWVNHVFGTLIEHEHRIQPEYIDLNAFLNSNGQETSPVVVVPSVNPYQRADAIRQEEAKLLAGTIKQVVEHEWPVRCEKTGELRSASYGDIAILLPSRTGLANYEDVFIAAGIPFRHEGGKEYFHRQEIRDLRACLRAVDNPGDTMSIVAALRSGAFGCSDQQLFEWRQTHGGFDYRDVDPELEGAVSDGLRVLNSLHEERINLSLPEIVERTIEQTNLVEFALTMRNGGDQSAANLLKMVDQARAFSSASGGGLRAFVRWTITSSETRSDESDAAVAESTDDVVRILTIHAAKGLEFPIVALANLNTTGTGQRGPQIVPNYLERRLDIRIGSKEYGYTTPDFEQASEFEELHDKAERLRLFYVAATRAADYLILPIAAQPDKAKGLLGSMIPFLPSLDDETFGRDANGVHVLDSRLLPPTEMTPPQRAPITSDEIEESHRARGEWLVRRENVLNDGNAPRRVITASSQKGWERNDTGETGIETAPVDSPVERNLALRIGNALHAIMEQIDHRRHATLDSAVTGLIESALDEADISANDHAARKRVQAMVQRALGSELLQRARNAAELVQEVEFGYGLADGGLMQGQMDLVFVEDNEIIVGDFKSDRINPGEAEQRTRQSYEGQAAVYAFAAHQVTGLPVREVIFYFAEVGEQVCLTGDELVERGREIALQGETQDLGYAITD